MAKKKLKVQEAPVRYQSNDAEAEGLRKIEKAVTRGLKKRSRLYNEIILKHERAWEKLANL
ncbi:MAG TPA: hypothetical protein VGR15_10840 [Bacteroidota bacterium]|nr:hypothetical protein [Bacteroidota bacterium]